MTIAKYCKEKGFNKCEYNNFKNNIKETAKTIRNNLKYRGGMYYNTSDILHYINSDIKYFIIQELKKLGVEFRNNDEEYRVVE